jgi:hypothetical protein
VSQEKIKIRKGKRMGITDTSMYHKFRPSLLGSLFYPEDEGRRLLRNVGNNCEGNGLKRLWPISRYYTSICLEGLMGNHQEPQSG